MECIKGKWINKKEERRLDGGYNLAKILKQ